MENNIVPKGSTIYFKTMGSNHIDAKAIVEEDTEVFKNAIIMINEGLYCTDINPVIKINDTEYEVMMWLQDVMLIDKGIFYNSTSDI